MAHVQALVDNKVHELMYEVINSEQQLDDLETAIWFIGNIQTDVPEIR